MWRFWPATSSALRKRGSTYCLWAALVFSGTCFVSEGLALYRERSAGQSMRVRKRALASSVAKCEQPSFNFGELFVGETAIHDFAVSNPGNRPLEVADIFRECGCINLQTTAGTRIAPGGVLSLPVALAAKNQFGPIRKSISVGFTDGSAINLHMEGIVKPRLSWSPEHLWLHTSGAGSGVVEKIITLSADPDLPKVAITSVTAGRHGLLVAQIEEHPSGSSWRVVVRSNNDSANRRVDDILTIRTTDKLVNEINIPVTIAPSENAKDR